MLYVHCHAGKRTRYHPVHLAEDQVPRYSGYNCRDATYNTKIFRMYLIEISLLSISVALDYVKLSSSNILRLERL